MAVNNKENKFGEQTMISYKSKKIFLLATSIKKFVYQTVGWKKIKTVKQRNRNIIKNVC